MDATVAELTGMLDPALSSRQLAALFVLAGIEPHGFRYTGRAGRPAPIYDRDAVIAVHAAEAQRCGGRFDSSDWIALSLLARALIVVDVAVGAIWWPDCTRAEKLGAGNYGWVRVGRVPVPAHRIVWIAADGPIPAFMQVIHDNRLRWDNRRANLYLASFGNSIRHARGTPYLTRDQAIRELAGLEPPEEPDPWQDLMRAPIPRTVAAPGMAVSHRAWHSG